MTASLPLDVSKWQEVIDSSADECLFSPLSAKTVEHVLSTATIRGPQKKLCSAVLSFIPKMLGNHNGIAILTSLVQYGTERTVGLVSSALLKADETVWTFKAQPEERLQKPLGNLLERLLYREDCSDEAYKKIVQAFKSVSRFTTFSSSFSLPAAGRLMTIDTAFAKQVAKDQQVKKAFCKASFDSATRFAAESCCSIILKGAAVGKDEELHVIGSIFVCDAFADNMRKDGDTRPREEILLALVTDAPSPVVDTVAERLATWTILPDLCKGPGYMKIVATALDRCSNEKVGVALVKRVFCTAEDVDDKLASRKTAPLHLLSSIEKKSLYSDALDKKVGGFQGKKLKAATVLFTNATVPKATATQNSIMEKLKMLRGSNAPQTKKGMKRLRKQE